MSLPPAKIAPLWMLAAMEVDCDRQSRIMNSEDVILSPLVEELIDRMRHEAGCGTGGLWHVRRYVFATIGLGPKYVLSRKRVHSENEEDSGD